MACGGGLVRGETYGGCTLDVLMVLRLITDLGGVCMPGREMCARLGMCMQVWGYAWGRVCICG